MKKVMLDQTMKTKFILCLALVLSGILLCCSSIALGADLQLQVILLCRNHLISGASVMG